MDRSGGCQGIYLPDRRGAGSNVEAGVGNARPDRRAQKIEHFVTAIMAFPEKIRTGGSAQGAGKSAGLKKVTRSRPGARERGSRRDGVTENS
jgi:hypothetical protein